MKPHVDIAKIPLWVLCVRSLTQFLLGFLFPCVINDKNQLLQKVRTASKKGDGLVIVYTHFSLRDAMEVNRSIIFKDPVLKKREVINPLAYHQNNLLMYLIGKFYHGTVAPIVNNSTLSKKGYEHLPKGKGLTEFIALSTKVLEKGGVITLAVNASRKEKLDMRDPLKPIGYLIASLQAKGIRNYGFLLVGFTAKNAKNYSKKEVGGMNIGKTYIINLANYYSLEELLNQSEVSAKVGNVDKFIRLEIAKVTPKEYLQN